jgi:hypothetical protein
VPAVTFHHCLRSGDAPPKRSKGYTMRYRKLICAIGMAGAVMMICHDLNAADRAKYPEWKGGWEPWANPILSIMPSKRKVDAAGAGQ